MLLTKQSLSPGITQNAKSEEGYTDRVWSAHLKDKPEIEFELISHPTYNLFMDYTMETTYHLEMGKILS